MTKTGLLPQGEHDGGEGGWRKERGRDRELERIMLQDRIFKSGNLSYKNQEKKEVLKLEFCQR